MILRAVAVLSALLAGARGAFVPADSQFVLCGTAASATVGGRNFVGDATLPAKVLSAAQSSTANASSGSAANASSGEVTLYQYARVFPAPSTYTFAIKKPGRHFVRLHFFPFRYQSGDLAADAKFTVSVQGVTVIGRSYTPANGTATVREFSVNVAGGTLAIAFTPTGKVAFVNAIEVVSHPDDLFAGPAQTVSSLGQYTGLSTQALETIHRINMGSPKITPGNDTLWRTWLPDDTSLLDRSLAVHKDVPPKSLQRMDGLASPEAAPDMVYATATELNKRLIDSTINAVFNVTWRFQATPGWAYLLRLHFCDIVSKAANQLSFNVYVEGRSVLSNYEITKDTFGSLAVPLYKDFVLSDTDKTGNITVSIGPSTVGNVDPDGLLNGLEILRMVGDTGSGGGDTSRSRSKKTIAGIVAGSAGVTVVVAVAFLVLRVRRRKKPEKKPSSTWAAFSASALGSGSRSRSRSFGKSNSGGARNDTVTLGQSTAGAGYRFPFAALQEATSGFDEGMVIGVGGFGKVYKGTLRDETRVAVKRGNRRSQQGLNEFRTEIQLLSRLRHRHLVSLIGYCDERGEMILVYEYMAKGTLRSHLYDSELPPLSWKQRLEASIGAARGLHYLHTGSTKAIIHRDVKSANILLDDSFMAKVADFGLSKTGPELDKTHVSTAVKGSFGYLDPEYFRRQMLTEKSDVYSFGVVLLEVLCARPVIDPTLSHDMVNLAEWATKKLKNGELDAIVDQRIAGTIRPESLKKFVDTAEKCLAEYGVERPAMGDVLWCLEYALQLQEASPDSSSTYALQLQEASPDSSSTDDTHLASGVASSKYQRNQSTASDGTAATMSANLGDLDGMSMRRVFSKMIKSEEGR
jgi:serine/threonine protein kinase